MLQSVELNQHPQALKTLLCPLFARDETQQALFYKVFDEVVQTHQPTAQQATSTDPLEEPLPETRKAMLLSPRVLTIVAVLLVGVSVALTIFLTEPGDGGTIDPKPPIVAVDTTPKVDSSNSKPSSAGRKPARQDTTATGRRNSTPKVPAPEQAEPEVPVSSIAETENPVQWEYADVPIPDVAYLRADTESWLEQHFGTLRYGFIALVMLLAAIREWIRWRKRVLAARRQKELKPPYSWPIHFEEEPKVDFGEDFYLAANQLRKRVEDAALALDVQGTVAATTRKAGALEVVYSQRTRPAEYLVLIDRSSAKNHQSALFDFVARALDQRDIHIERYYYDADPRMCWKESTPHGISIESLFNHYPHYRLLVFGAGGRFIDPARGSLTDWTSRFREWKERALFTPVASQDWGHRELVLNELFVVLPGTAAGMKSLVEHFEQHKPSNLYEWKYQAAASAGGIRLNGHSDVVMERIQEYLPPEQLAWLSACALYPELFWDLTLYIGSVLETPAKPLLTLENLVRFSRMEWFKKGAIPDDFRQRIMFNESLLSKEERHKVAQALADLFRNNTPKNRNTFAWEKHRMELVLSELMLDPKGKEKKALLRELRVLNEGKKRIEQTALVFLQKMQLSALDFVLPKEVRKNFFRNGFSFSGLKPGLRTAFVLATLCTALLWPAPKKDCSQTMVFAGVEYCTPSPADKCNTLASEAARLFIPGREIPEKAFALLEQAHELDAEFDEQTWQDIYYVLHYNQAVYFFNNKRYYEVADTYNTGTIGMGMLSFELPVAALLRTTEFLTGELTATEIGKNLEGLDGTIASTPYPNLESLVRREFLLEQLNAALLAQTEPVGANDYLDVGYLIGQEAPRRLVLNREGFYGYLDANDEEAIRPTFLLAKPFVDGVAGVFDGKYWGLINSDGKEVAEARWNEIGHIGEGYATVRMGNKWGYLKIGSNASPRRWFEEAGPFKEGFAYVKGNLLGTAQYWFINTKLQDAIGSRYDAASSFSDGLAAVKQGNRYFYLQANGKRLNDSTYAMAHAPDEGLLRVLQDGKWQYLRSDGTPLTENSYDELFPFSEGLAVYQIEDEFGRINREGQTVGEQSMTVVGNLHSGRAVAYGQDGVLPPKGYVDANGNWQISAEFIMAFPFEMGFAQVRVGENTVDIIDRAGNPITPDGMFRVASPTPGVWYGLPLLSGNVQRFGRGLNAASTTSSGLPDSFDVDGIYAANGCLIVQQLDLYQLYSRSGHRISNKQFFDYTNYDTDQRIFQVADSVNTYYINKAGRCVWDCPSYVDASQISPETAAKIKARIRTDSIADLLRLRAQDSLQQKPDTIISEQSTDDVFGTSAFEWIDAPGGKYVLKEYSQVIDHEPLEEQGHVILNDEFSLALIIGAKNGKFGAFDRYGDETIPFIYQDIDGTNFAETGVLSAQYSAQLSVTINDEGKAVENCEFCAMVTDGTLYESDLRALQVLNRLDNRTDTLLGDIVPPMAMLYNGSERPWMLWNIREDKEIPTTIKAVDHIQIYNSEIALVAGNNGAMFISPDGLNTAKFDQVYYNDQIRTDYPSTSNMVHVRDGKYHGYYDTDIGDTNDPPQWKDAKAWNGTTGLVEGELGWEYLYFGDYLGTYGFKDAKPAIENYGVVKDSKGWGVIDLKKTFEAEQPYVLLNPLYRDVELILGSTEKWVAVQKSNRKWQLYDLNTSEISGSLLTLVNGYEFDRVSGFDGPLCYAQYQGREVYFDLDGNCYGCEPDE